MNNKTKNIVSNLIGLVIIGFGIYKYNSDSNINNLLVLLLVGIALFLFKVSETKSWINKFLSRGNVNQEVRSGIGGELPDEDDEDAPA